MNEQCICSECDHADNCQSAGAECCICADCAMCDQCCKPGSGGCKCCDCMLAQDNCCQPDAKGCLCNTCSDQMDCIKGQTEDGHQSGMQMKSHHTHDEDDMEDEDVDYEEDSYKRFKKGSVEYRAVSLRASITGGAEEGQPLLKTLTGRAIVFDTPTPIFQDYDGTQYYEQIHRDALNGVDLSNVVLKYNHSEHVPPLASTRAGTLDLKADDQGLGVTARMANTTQASDIHELVRTGHLSKMSFAFTVANDAYDTKTKTRTIFNFDKVYDVSVVDFPAYEQTSISARNYIKAQQEARSKEMQRQEQLAWKQREARKHREAKKQRRAKLQEQNEQRQQLILKTFL